MTTLKRLQRARTHLLLDHPFFGTLALKLKLIEAPGVGTAMTNGVYIKYDPEWIDSLTDEEIKGVLAHEILHIANGHCWRRDNREHGLWNVAADYALNGLLEKAGLTIPNVGLHGRSGSAERIYRELQEEQNSQPDAASDSDNTITPEGDEEAGDEGVGSDKPAQSEEEQEGSDSSKPQQHTTPDPGGCGGVEDAPINEEDGGGKKLEEDWKVAIAQAATSAGRGTLPAGLQRMIEEVVNPKVPWTVVLRDFVDQAARNDYDWTQVNRRHVGRGIVLPSLRSDELPEIVIAVDTSGSIGDEILNQFAAEISDVLGSYNTKAHVLYIDTDVQEHEELTSEDLPIELHPKGGGGTDFQPAFDWIEENDITPSCLVYLTDMAGRFPTDEPDYPTLWAVVCDYGIEAPFGEEVSLND